LSYFFLRKLPLDDEYVYLAAILIVIGIRLMAVRFKIVLPNIYKTK